MIESKDLEPKEKLPNKEERQKDKEEREKTDKDVKALKEILIKFVNEQLISLDMPLYLVEEMATTLIKPLLSIHKAKSTQYKNFLEAKRILEETNINKLYYVEEAKK